MCLLARMDEWDAQHIVCAATNHRDTDHPLRTRSGLLSPAAIEYAAQAMALHGALVGHAAGTPASPGFLASARAVQLQVLRLDDLERPQDSALRDELRVQATRQAGDANQIMYEFTVSHLGRSLAQGRATVVLNTTLAA
jgi:predicted hotdog family 3-hydroxylacyl-ACP dehydratase